jgi:hypothetical protein
MFSVEMEKCDVSGMTLSCSQKDNFGDLVMDQCRVDDENVPLRILDYAVDGKLSIMGCDIPGTIIQGKSLRTTGVSLSTISISSGTKMAGSTFFKAVLGMEIDV